MELIKSREAHERVKKLFSKWVSEDETNHSGSCSTPTEKPSGISGRCISCAGEASTNIVRDENFGKVMRFYWEILSVDVKPKESKSHDLCAECWNDMVEFYDVNELHVLIGKHLSSQQKTFIGKSLKGIKKLGYIPLCQKRSTKKGLGFSQGFR